MNQPPTENATYRYMRGRQVLCGTHQFDQNSRCTSGPGEAFTLPMRIFVADVRDFLISVEGRVNLGNSRKPANMTVNQWYRNISLHRGNLVQIRVELDLEE